MDENIEPKPDVFMVTKELEASCLSSAMEKIPWLQKYKIISDSSQERPDFLLEAHDEIIGIEHFHIDLLYLNKKKHTSLSRYTFGQIKELWEKYNPKAKDNTFTSQDADDSRKMLENIINELIQGQNDLDYGHFIKEWKRVFAQHYKSRYDCRNRNNLSRLGYMIEIRKYFDSPYICNKNGSDIQVTPKNIPLTKDIVSTINTFDDGVDFYILVVKELLNDSASVKVFDKDNIPYAEYDSFRFKPITSKIQID